MNHRVVGLAGRVFNGGKNVFSLQEGVISKNLFKGSPASQEIQDVGNAETKSPNAGAASALSFFHRYPLQPFDAHKLEVYDGLGQRARKSQPRGREKPQANKTVPRYGCFLRLNPAWESGYTRDEIKAKRFFDFAKPDDMGATRKATVTKMSRS